MDGMPDDLPPPLAAEEAIRYFLDRGYKITFNWRDMEHAGHALGFTVAKVATEELLAVIRNAVAEALKEGLTLAEFRRRLEPKLRAAGWWGRRTMIDPKTGEPVSAQLGSPRRLRTIYDTNLRQAWSAGQWERIERTKDDLPLLEYVAIRDARTRPAHLAWGGTVLPVDHPFWRSHTPMNGWRCRCRLRQLTGGRISPDPVIRTKPWTNTRTGETIQQPEGIDPGFAYNPGQAHRQFHSGVTAGWPQADKPAKQRRGQSVALDNAFRTIFAVPPGREDTLVAGADGVQLILSVMVYRQIGGAPATLDAVRAAIVAPATIRLVSHLLKDGSVELRRRYIGKADDDRVMVVERQRDGFALWRRVSAANAARLGDDGWAIWTP